jgi:hypothetical protein
MRALVTLAFVLGCTASTVAAPTTPDVRVYESPSDDAITEGETIISADPDVAYHAAVDYPRWSAIFPDIRHVAVTQQQGVDARVTFIYADDHRDNVHFHNVPAARKLWFEDTGGRAEVWAEIVFSPGAVPGTTRVHSRVYADVHGFTGLFVSNGRLRRARTERVRGDLTHLRAYFAGAHVATE